jgi:hypothetical protein
MTIFLKEFGKFHLNIIKLLCDYQANTKLGHTNRIFHTRMLHVELHYHYVHMKVLVNKVEMKYILV